MEYRHRARCHGSDHVKSHLAFYFSPETPDAVSYQQTAILHAVVTPPVRLLGDIVYADARTHRPYFAGSAKPEIDVWNTRTKRFLGAMTGGFTGLTGSPPASTTSDLIVC